MRLGALVVTVVCLTSISGLAACSSFSPVPESTVPLQQQQAKQSFGISARDQWARMGLLAKYFDQHRQIQFPSFGKAGPTSARPAGNLYLSDFNFQRITSQVDVFENKTFTEIGSITYGISIANGQWVDKQKNLYVTNDAYPAGNVLEYACTKNACSSSPNFTYSSGLSGPTSVTTDQNGNVFVADFTAQTVEEFAQGSNTVQQQCSFPSNVEGVAVDSSTGDVFVSYNGPGNSGVIEEFSGGLAGCSGTTLGAAIGAPGHMILDNNKNIIVCDQANSAVDIIAPPYGSVTKQLGLLWLDPYEPKLETRKGHLLLYVDDPGTYAVQVYSYPAGKLKGALERSSGFKQPVGIADTFNLVM